MRIIDTIMMLMFFGTPIIFLLLVIMFFMRGTPIAKKTNTVTCIALLVSLSILLLFTQGSVEVYGFFVVPLLRTLNGILLIITS